MLPLLLAEKTVVGILKGFQAVSQACKTSEKSKEIWSFTLGKMDEKKKLVVYTQDINVEIEETEAKRILNDYIPAGTAKVKVKVMDNRVQYVIPLDQITEECFVYNPTTKKFVINCPPVKIDQTMVVVQSNPEKIIKEQSGSWVPVIGPDVDKLTDKVLGQIKTEVIRQANHQIFKEKARKEAIHALESLFQVLKNSLSEGIDFQIMLP